MLTTQIKTDIPSCVTRVDSTPFGLQKIYFASFAEDYDNYFIPLTQEILRCRDCAVYYREGGITLQDLENPDELTDVLSQTELAVIPITEKLLTDGTPLVSFLRESCDALGIPLLPIAVEPGLYELYSLRFGNIQYLDRTSKDPTGIPYGQKLADFLNRVLLDDKTVSEIREAFDGYIFLSYRKRNRREAQGLMHLIHRVPKLRDMAIWYDEFLVPTEDWSDSIRDKMEHSKMVAFAVTPEMLEEGNYVLREEMPEALRLGRPILSARVKDTDENDYQRTCPQLPEMIDAEDAAALEERLLSLLNNEKLRTKDSPQQDYLIGLAYLGGIDVEPDPERGIVLLESAGSTDHTDAIKRLISFFEDTQGPFSADAPCIKWQSRLAEILSSKSDETKAPSDIRDSAEAFDRLASMYIQAELPEDACVPVEKAIGLSDAAAAEAKTFRGTDKTDDTKLSDSIVFLRITSRMRLATALSKLGSSKCIPALEDAVKIAEAAAEPSLLFACRMQLAEALEEDGLYTRAEAEYSALKDIRLNELTGNDEDLGASVDNTQSIYYLRLLYLQHLAELHEKKAEWEEAAKYREEAAELLRAKADESGDSGDFIAWAKEAYQLVACEKNALNAEDTAAIDKCLADCELLKNSIEEFGLNSITGGIMAMAFAIPGEIELKKGKKQWDKGGMLLSFLRAKELAGKLYSEHPTVSAKRLYAEMCSRLGIVTYSFNEKEGLELLEEAARVLEEEVKRERTDKQRLADEDLAELYALMYSASELRIKRSLHYAEKELEIRKRLNEETEGPSFGRQADLGSCLARYGKTLVLTGKGKDGHAMIVRAKRLLESLNQSQIDRGEQDTLTKEFRELRIALRAESDARLISSAFIALGVFIIIAIIAIIFGGLL